MLYCTCSYNFVAHKQQKQTQNSMTMANNQFNVSEETSSLLNCIATMNSFYDQVSKSASGIWGNEQTEKVLEPFTEKYQALRVELQKLLMDSIDLNLSQIGSRTI